MRKIELTNSKKKVKVSDEDYDFLHFVGPWKLCAGHAFSIEHQVFIEELVLGGFEVFNIKHKNGKKLDCRRKNLKGRGSPGKVTPIRKG